MNAKEGRLRIPVITLLRSMGFRPVVEFCLGRWQADIVAGSFDERVSRKIPECRLTVAVELKLSRVAEAERQALHYSRFVNSAYVAFPRDVAEKNVDRFAGSVVGLISVDLETGGAFELIRPLVAFHHVPKRERERIARNLWRRLGTDRPKPAETGSFFNPSSTTGDWK